MLNDRMLIWSLPPPLVQVIYIIDCWPSGLELRRMTRRGLAEETLAKTASRTVYWKLPLSRLLPTRMLSKLNACFLFFLSGGGDISEQGHSSSCPLFLLPG